MENKSKSKLNREHKVIEPKSHQKQNFIRFKQFLTFKNRSKNDGKI